MNKRALLPLLICGMLIGTASVSGQSDIAGRVASAFDSVWIVAIGENHGHQELHELIIGLLEDPSIQSIVDDVVVEFGNAHYQALVDRFVAGDPVPRDSVQMAWRNTVVSPNTVWDAPVYGQFYEALRRINQERTDGRAYRLVLGDPPVLWDDVRGREDLAPFYGRSEHIASTVGREVLRHGRRALLLAGGAHLTRVNMVRRNRAGVPVAERSVVSRLQSQYPGTLWVVRSLGRSAGIDLTRVVAQGDPLLRDAAAEPFGKQSANSVSTMRNNDGTAFEAYGTATLADLVDAVIVWPADQRTFVDARPEDFDEAYRAELERRTRIVRGGA